MKLLKPLAVLSLPALLSGCLFVKAPNRDAFDRFGEAVAINDDIMVVGAANESSRDNRINGDQHDNSMPSAGAAYIYRNDPNKWEFKTYLKPSNTHANQFFGASVDIESNSQLVAVGATYDLHTGAVFVFREVAFNHWVELDKVKPFIVDFNDEFSYSVALSGDGRTLVVGAPGNDSGSAIINAGEHDNSMSDAGAVYVFKQNGNVWYQVAFLKPANPDRGDRFGSSVDINFDGNTIVVGAPYERSCISGSPWDNRCMSAGAAYTFKLLGPSFSAWTQTAYLKAPSPKVGDTVGYDVAINDFNTRIAVGAPGIRWWYGTPDMPATHIYENHWFWSHTQTLMPTIVQQEDKFGWSVDFSPNGQYLLIGAPGERSSGTGLDMPDDNDPNHESGASYLYVFDGAQYTEKHYIKGASKDSGDQIGFSVAINTQMAAFGLPGDDAKTDDPLDNDLDESGAVIAFDLLDDLNLWPDY